LRNGKEKWGAKILSSFWLGLDLSDARVARFVCLELLASIADVQDILNLSS